MCSIPTDPFSPNEILTADPARRAEIQEWLDEEAMIVDTCGGCAAVEFLCSAQCAEAFRQGHLACAAPADARDAPARDTGALVVEEVSLADADAALHVAGDAVREVARHQQAGDDQPTAQYAGWQVCDDVARKAAGRDLGVAW